MQNFTHHCLKHFGSDIPGWQACYSVNEDGRTATWLAVNNESSVAFSLQESKTRVLHHFANADDVISTGWLIDFDTNSNLDLHSVIKIIGREMAFWFEDDNEDYELAEEAIIEQIRFSAQQLSHPFAVTNHGNILDQSELSTISAWRAIDVWSEWIEQKPNNTSSTPIILMLLSHWVTHTLWPENEA